MSTVPASLALDLSAVGLDGDHSSNALVLVSPSDVRDDIACEELLSIAPPGELDVLLVTLTQSPDDRLTVWRTHCHHELPAKTGIVSVGEQNRTASLRIEEGEEESVSIASIADPSDLTALGIQISDFVSEWGDDGNRTVVCFHSLTALLQYVETQRAFKFLHVLSGRLDGTNAVAHYHMDPEASNSEDVKTMRTLMDLVVEVDDAGSWVISQS